MNEISRLRLFLMRAMYLLIAVGLSLSTLSELFAGIGQAADSHTVISTFLLTLILLSLVGLVYPLKMLPVLLFEVIWKSAWLLLFALPMWLKAGLDEYAVSVAIACLMGVVLTPIAVPWGYVARQYFGYHLEGQTHSASDF